MKGTVALQGRTVPYVVRQSQRARRISLLIRDTSGVEVVVPRPVPPPVAEQFIRSHTLWVLRTLDRLKRYGPGNGVTETAHGMRIPFLGEERLVRVEAARGRRASAHAERGEIVLSVPSETCGDIRLLLQRWLMLQARAWIPRRVEDLNASLGFPFQSVSVRNQRTRWGSCSRRGTLSFNWRLVLLPPFVADYLIFHELAHLKHLNHSARYWHLVERVCPDYRLAERWLRKNGRSLPL